jgi:citrate synthase
MAEQTLSVTDNRTGKNYTLPLVDGNIRAMDLRKIKVEPDDFGVMSYDPSFLNTASCRSSITYIDGDRGILRYRGYPIEVLAERCTFLEVAWLILRGELPTAAELKAWEKEVTYHSMIHENVRKIMDAFLCVSHPMHMLTSTIAALAAFYKDARDIDSQKARELQILRLIAKVPNIGAYCHRHSRGLPYVYPDNTLGYTENFMSMLWKMTEPKYEPDPIVARALEVLFILHADHEQNCSTSVMRAVGSSLPDPYVATGAAAAALSGPLHGGANEEVLRMLDQIGTVDQVPAYVEYVKSGKTRLMGFGHRIYKDYDPRARIIKETAEKVFEVTGRSPRLDVALELEKVALEDEYFVKRRLYPNVDFYSGIIYEALGFDPEIFTVLFAIPRTVGWLAQWQEMLQDPEQKIARPRQVYTGDVLREFVPMEERGKAAGATA